MKNQTVIIIGANSAIAKALVDVFIADSNTQLILVSRNVDDYQHDLFNRAKLIDVKNYQECEIDAAMIRVKQVVTFDISNVFICNGVLHNQHCQPEKRLEDFTASVFTEIITANTITPMLWLKNLVPILPSSQNCKIVVFSARVGSISDNKLGGWYSYRASKAAMNMLIKSAAVELARRAKNIKLISFHPGTTDSPLSQPFQKNVPKGKLFTREFVAKQLLKVVEDTPVDGEASFLDWQGKDIPW
ncbi:MAG: SDR family NAD(P)-dependent oxidoreductase [Moritella sp.]|uniref:SDR family NAD(P)-dependent oxidoreductase n=1 Tax=Moritella sp. TaxID=78556 RepID=UPI0029B19577|nr:SDR family NAD(P)-dependent oxidoreductase [Moritella sp.]MDX2321299.1 SDR family NAD(P)-dependent oxidoreductase [Moritella sp.]